MTAWNRHWRQITEEDILKPIPPEVLREIAGNAPPSVKKDALTWYRLLGFRGDTGFEYATRKLVKVQEVSLEPSIDDPEKISTKMVCEVQITPEMCNADGVLSTPSMYSMIDEGSAISLLLMRIVEAGEDAEHQTIGVSQTLNVFFHHPAPGPGSKITLVSRSISTQGDMGCCKCEIWDKEKHRLIVTGTQLQMMPSAGREARPEKGSKQGLPVGLNISSMHHRCDSDFESSFH